jgi:septal ring factor EnvC (AmiA/AmiB activator)
MNMALIYLLCLYTINVQLHNIQLELEEANLQLFKQKENVASATAELDSVCKDLSKTEEMLKRKNTELSNNKTGGIVEKLQKELKVAKAQSALLKEQLDSSKLSNKNSLVDDECTSSRKRKHCHDESSSRKRKKL